MKAETLFEAREGSDESPTTAIVRHSSSMRRIDSFELICTATPLFGSDLNWLCAKFVCAKPAQIDETVSIELCVE